ncbi:hypothetical protein BZ163_05385 [Pseudomonas sp. VI4.1]|nr:hypothetical protein BZ163_05385 [Pseudomonas sp. VI4.1]
MPQNRKPKAPPPAALPALASNPPFSKSHVPHKPSTMFVIAPDIDTESLLAHACESLASASVMASDFATFVDGPQRSMVLGIQQVIMLADRAVNRALDNLDPQG